MFKKSFLIALLIVCSQAQAATWDRMMKQGGVTYYMESGSGSAAPELDNVVRSHFRVDLDKPQKLSDGKYYDRTTTWLSMDCSTRRFLATNTVYYINGAVVSRNSGKSNSWVKYDASKNLTNHKLWRQTCLQ